MGSISNPAPGVGTSVETSELVDESVTAAKVKASEIPTLAADNKFTGKIGFNSATAIGKPTTYTQTFAETTRTHAAGALPTNISATLVTELDTALNTTNTAVNEVKKLLNQAIDDLQSYGLLQ